MGKEEVVWGNLCSRCFDMSDVALLRTKLNAEKENSSIINVFSLCHKIMIKEPGLKIPKLKREEIPRTRQKFK